MTATRRSATARGNYRVAAVGRNRVRVVPNMRGVDGTHASCGERLEAPGGYGQRREPRLSEEPGGRRGDAGAACRRGISDCGTARGGRGHCGEQLRLHPGRQGGVDPGGAGGGVPEADGPLPRSRRERLSVSAVPPGASRSLPEVDAFIGTGEFPRIAEIVRATLDRAAGDRVWVTGHTALMTAALPRRRLTPPHVAYLKIAEGCDHACRFCAIPLIRGPKQSRERADIVAEARALAADGVREVVLISQDTTSYGTDRGESGGLTALLRDLLTIPALRWLRLHYLHPARITPDLIALLAAEPRLCRYVDLPLQHADAAVLKAMGRAGSIDGFRRLIGRIRKAVPDAIIRTSFITGFPGETAAQFAVLARFVEEMRFDRMGVFRYSDEEGTAAAALGPKVSRRVAEARRARLMALQARIAEEKGLALVGSVQEVLVDGPASEFPDPLCG